jgi:hypothetical protein
MVAAGRLKRLAPGVKIEQHKRVRGRESGCLREVDVLVTGTIAGIPTSLIVECKHLREPVGIELVDSYRLRDELTYYIAATQEEKLDEARIRKYFDEYQQIWDQLGSRWMEYRRAAGSAA